MVVYWTDYVLGHIMYFKPDGRYHAILLRGLNNPRALAIDPVAGCVCVCNLHSLFTIHNRQLNFRVVHSEKSSQCFGHRTINQLLQTQAKVLSTFWTVTLKMVESHSIYQNGWAIVKFICCQCSVPRTGFAKSHLETKHLQNLAIPEKFKSYEKNSAFFADIFLWYVIIVLVSTKL